MDDEAAFACFFFIPLWAIAGYFVGASRGSAVQGAAIGAFLGPIGLAIILIFWRDQRPKCIFCKAAIEEGARKCKSCGSRVPRCPECGKKLPRQQIPRCKECRTKLTDEDWDD